ncbi:hypothetical protein BJY04DRAFT_217465 [Aspergillus karnatakaensis]|uniref:Zn(II)2Cys6 transcription factor n=1 Tax=Aspergillus karnatakaensis TaxID=1810916 RepID=UPI003CCCE1EC
MTSHNRGSPGCESCRRRRIKCNQLRPRCSQCARAGLSCSGYRVPLDLLFQDETAKIERMVRKNKPMASAVHNAFPPPPSPSLSLIGPTVQVEDVAWKYYLLNFNITRNKPNCFPGPYLAGSSIGMASVTSVGLAALALVHQDPHLMQLARTKYSAALRFMAQAMHNPQELLNGATTTASFNLSIFEMMTSHGPDAAYSWLRHIHGTAALMRVELIPSHEAVFGTSLTGRLQILFTVAMGCLISEQLVPPHVVRFATSLTLPAMSADVSLVIELFILLSNVINLYLEAKMLRSGDQRSEDITTALYTFSADLLNWESRLPPLWTSAPYDEATNWIPRLLGYYRLCRILTQRVMLDYTHPSLQQEKLSRQVLEDMCMEIYKSFLPMLQHCFEPCLSLTSDVIFLVTILQALLKVTNRKTVVESWAGPSDKVLGPGFAPLRVFVNRQLC